MPENGTPDFTHKLQPFMLEGVTFRRRKVRPEDWADVLDRTAEKERELTKENKVTLRVSAEGLHELILLAIVPEQHEDWNRLRAEGRVEWGELTSLREWIWEQTTSRPFPTDTSSSSGGGSAAPSSGEELPSRAVAPRS